MKGKTVKEYYLQGEFYDWVTHPKYLEKIFHWVRERRTVKLIEKFGENSVILDVGCGTGLVTRHIKGSLTVGLDLSRWNLERTKIHAPRAELILGDGERSPIRSGSVDTIICTETLEHLPSPQNAIHEIVRVLKPGGKIIVSVPSRSPVWRFRRFLSSTCSGSEPFHKNYTFKELESLLKGLRIVDISKHCFGLTLFFVVEKQITRILITNVFNFFNKGEVMHLEALTKHLRVSAFSVLSIYSFINPKVCESLGVKVAGTYKPRHLPHLATWSLYTFLRAFLWRLTRLKVFLGKDLTEILNSDVVVDLGGDTFTDETGIMYAIAHSYSLLLAKTMDKPYIICSQTIGPFKNPVTKRLAGYVLHGALAITPREPLTYNYLTGKMGLENVYLAPDIAFLSSTTANPSKSITNGFTIGLNVSPMISNWMFPNTRGLKEKQELFIKLMSEVVAYIFEQYDCRILLIPHVTGPADGIDKRLRDDRVVARMIFGELKGEHSTRLILIDDPSVINQSISRCSIFIGSRMHSVISAISAKVPTIPLAYSHKTLGSVKMLGLSDYVIDVRNKTSMELKSQIIAKFEDVLSDYDRATEVFGKSSQKGMRDATLHLKVIENSKLLSLFKKKQCRGCGTCVIGCPHGAISMVLTHSGIYRPRITFEKCTGCEECIKVCPLEQRS